MRWTYRRKAAIVSAVDEGTVSIDDVCRENFISIEEFTSWKKLIDQAGVGSSRGVR
jgi:hypothetical protein